MKNKNILLAIFFVVWYIMIFGFVVPSFISAKDDILPLAGAALSIFHVMVPILWFNREKKEDTKKDSV